jgi:hypothetical protein
VPLPTQVIADLLGFPEEAADMVFDWSLRRAATQDADARSGGVEESLSALQEIVLYRNEIAAQRRAHPREDLLSRRATLQLDGEHLAPELLGALVGQRMVAGNETTRNPLTIGVKAPLEHAGQWPRLLEGSRAHPHRGRADAALGHLCTTCAARPRATPRSPACRSPRAPRSCAGSSPATATPSSTPGPSASTSRAPRHATRASAAAGGACAWAPGRPGWSCGSPCRSSRGAVAHNDKRATLADRHERGARRSRERRRCLRPRRCSAAS